MRPYALWVMVSHYFLMANNHPQTARGVGAGKVANFVFSVFVGAVGVGDVGSRSPPFSIDAAPRQKLASVYLYSIFTYFDRLKNHHPQWRTNSFFPRACLLYAWAVPSPFRHPRLTHNHPHFYLIPLHSNKLFAKPLDVHKTMSYSPIVNHPHRKHKP